MEQVYRDALDVARRQGAKGPELRTATSYADAGEVVAEAGWQGDAEPRSWTRSTTPRRASPWATASTAARRAEPSPTSWWRCDPGHRVSLLVKMSVVLPHR